ncbi:putative uroporphyrinogen-III C-methyltransferase [Rosa chinensis]|uniref:Putative uroporphyrinogen-III C-methyltransferase n=1 Tax=Rosa chinensis TaxID=74649 RepID=A0A2P6QV23_ROSCH|nr:putative uroporphyrinogen-III C-methyltransferase [Rosa chinensis]
MALVSRLQSLSSSLSSTHFGKPNSLNPQPLCSLHFNSPSYTSPFTEKHSIERYQRDQYNNQLEQTTLCSLLPDCDADSDFTRQNDIALQLPELRKLLQVLREKREREGRRVLWRQVWAWKCLLSGHWAWGP